jgi:aspartyl-tRNA(Asn)/glutamyl-tRNA(Gln) amidotransferase subunit A
VTAPGFATLIEVKDALAAKRISSVELTQTYLARIAAHSHLGSFITVCEDSALEAARRADRAIAEQGHRQLLGVPIAHKDVFCTEGVRTTCASRMLASFTSPYDATVVAKLKQAGAVTLGKTNMDEFAMGSSNETSHFGAVSNPWDPSRVPGGSSGGSAAAVAAGLAAAATGTDTGGSIRQPAAFCGISGLKPTYGRVSRFGLVAFASSLDQAGPMARTAADLRALLQSMEGHDPADSTSAFAPPTGGASTPTGGKGMTVGIAAQFWDGLDNRIATALADAGLVLERLGHRRADIALPHADYAVPAYYVIASAEASTNLSRYDGVRYGHRAESPQDIEDLYRRSRTEGFGVEVKRRILTGTYALSVGYYDAYYRRAQRLRRLIRDDFMQAFQHVDAILAPATPTTAFPKGMLKEAQDPTVMYRQDVFTVPASLAGLPALSIPCGFRGGLPIGMQLIGPHFQEDRLLALAEAFQSETDWHLRTPDAAKAPAWPP